MASGAAPRPPEYRLLRWRGTPLGNGRSVSSSGTSSSSSDVAGYSIVEAADADATVALMDGHPHLKTGTIEVLEAIELPGM